MTADELIARARSALGKRVPYFHEFRGIDYTSVLPPADRTNGKGLDCGTFVRWAAKLQLPAGRRWDTTGIVVDALSTRDYFETLQDGPQRGCLVVYPDYVWQTELSLDLAAQYRRLGGASDGKNHGHIGIVTQTTRSAQGREEVVSVIHCSRLTEGYRQVMQPDSDDGSIIESGPLWFGSFPPIYVAIRWPVQAGER